MRRYFALLLKILSLSCIICLFLSTGCEKARESVQVIRHIGKPPDKARKKVLYERDLKKLAGEGNYVLVDKDEKDIFIQEDLYSPDYSTIIDLGRIKAEGMGVSLFTEDAATLGSGKFIEEINPIDRKAYHDFLMTETMLLDPVYFNEKKYLNEENYNVNRAEAMDKGRTVDEMVDFIDRYPESKMIDRAFSYLEFQVCVVQKNPDGAIQIYEKIKEKHKDKLRLILVANEYIKRARENRENYKS